MGSFPPTFILFFLRHRAVLSVSLERSSRNPSEADLWTRKSLSIFHGLTFDLASVRVYGRRNFSFTKWEIYRRYHGYRPCHIR